VTRPIIRVVVADDHPVYRSGLRTLIEESPGLAVAGEAVDGAEAVALCVAEQPDVVLMDVRMPGTSGVEATRRVRDGAPGTAVLVLTMLEDDTTVAAMLRAGARGYLLKGAGPDEIVRAVTAVAAGGMIFGATMAPRVAGLVVAGAEGGATAFPELTRRERDVLDLVAAGRSNLDIAARLGLNEKTVRNNVSAVFAKLRVADRAEAIVRARDAGLGR
jgi:DNA-binding NarL/FixJ family response regulator